MSRITMQNFKEPYVALLREGTTEDPYVNITETVKIVPRIEESSLAPARKPIAILREIPVDTYGVSATVKGTPDIELIEIRDSLSEPDAAHFKVDYTNGRVYLSNDYETGTIEFTYKGRGVICVTAQRVIVDTGGDANDVSTLADIIDMQLSELNVGNLNDLLTTDKDYVVDAINEVYTNAINILSDLNAHKIDYLNPHQTTKEQVELGNVDNTSDINKPVSIAQKTYIDDADSILQDQIDALRGSFIYIGSINLNTADVTQELLSARALEIMGGTTIELGWVLIDNEKHEWYYNANTTTWIDFEQPNIYQASNSIYGIVKGDGTDVSIANGIITVNNAGNASSLGGVVAANYATKEYVDANGGKVVTVFNNIEDVIASQSILFDGMVVKTKGYYTENDGGGAEYIISESDLSASVDDGSIIELVSTSKYLILTIKDYVNVKQFGAKGDGETDDTNSFNNMLTKLNMIFIPKGIYMVNINVENENSKLYGIGKDSVLISNNSNYVINLGVNANTYEIKDIVIDGNSISNYGVIQSSYNTESRHDCHGLIENVEIKNCLKDGLFICVNNRENRFTNIYSHNNGENGFSLCGSDNFISNSTFSNNGFNGLELKKNTNEIPANSDSNNIINCKAFYNGEDSNEFNNFNGFSIKSSRNNISNCNAQENFGSGIYIDDIAESNQINGIILDGNGTTLTKENAYGVHLRGANNNISGSVNNAILNGGINACLCIDSKYAFNNNININFVNYNVVDNSSNNYPNCVIIKNPVLIPFNKIIINGEKYEEETYDDWLSSIEINFDNDFTGSDSKYEISDDNKILTLTMSGYDQSATDKKISYRRNIWNGFPEHNTIYIKCKARLLGVDKHNGFDIRLTATTGYNSTNGDVKRYLGCKYYNTGNRYSHILRNVDDWQDLILVCDCSTVDKLSDFNTLWGILIGFELFKNGKTSITSDVKAEFKDIKYKFY